MHLNERAYVRVCGSLCEGERGCYRGVAYVR